MTYRILCVTDENDEISYTVQKKLLWFYVNSCPQFQYLTSAQTYVYEMNRLDRAARIVKKEVVE